MSKFLGPSSSVFVSVKHCGDERGSCVSDTQQRHLCALSRSASVYPVKALVWGRREKDSTIERPTSSFH